jgi:hypothetical protein
MPAGTYTLTVAGNWRWGITTRSRTYRCGELTAELLCKKIEGA